MTPVQNIKPYWLSVALNTGSKNQLSGDMGGLYFQYIVSLLLLSKCILSLFMDPAAVQILTKHSLFVQELTGQACTLTLEKK